MKLAIRLLMTFFMLLGWPLLVVGMACYVSLMVFEAILAEWS